MAQTTTSLATESTGGTVTAAEWNTLHGAVDANANDAESRVSALEGGVGSLTSAEVTQLANINDATITSVQWAYLGGMDQAVAAADSPSFAGLSLTGALTTTSTIDGRDIASDGGKLDGIEAGADVTDSANVASALGNGLEALTTAEVTQLGAIGATTISATQWGYLGALDQGLATTDAVTFATVDGRDVSADGSKLDGIEAGATADQTAQEIATAIDADATAEATLVSALGVVQDSTDLTYPASDKTVSYTLVASDAGRRIRFNAGTALTVTVPAGVFADGDLISVRQIGAGTLTIAGATGVTLNPTPGDTLDLAGQHGVAAIECDGGDVFAVYGTLAKA